MQLFARVQKRLAHFELEMELSCRAGELAAVVGPSGSGKTTLLRILAGLERPDAGEVRLGGDVWWSGSGKAFVPPRKRRIGYVFQEHPLMPHLSLAGNVAYAAADKSLVNALLERFLIDHLAGARPAGVSGGERQRCALAQALASRPSCLLLDEPFSCLDPLTTADLHEELCRIKRDFDIPVVLVTHDLHEALAMGDTVTAVRSGRADPAWLDKVIAMARSRRPPAICPRRAKREGTNSD